MTPARRIRFVPPLPLPRNCKRSMPGDRSGLPHRIRRWSTDGLRAPVHGSGSTLLLGGTRSPTRDNNADGCDRNQTPAPSDPQLNSRPGPISTTPSCHLNGVGHRSCVSGGGR